MTTRYISVGSAPRYTWHVWCPRGHYVTVVCGVKHDLERIADGAQRSGCCAACHDEVRRRRLAKQEKEAIELWLLF